MRLFNSERIDDLKSGRQKIDDLKKARNTSLIIHYSCESFFNNQGKTPRVTSIAIKNRSNGRSISFAIHLEAEKKHIELKNISNEDYEMLEREMLKNFYKYMNKYKTHKWINWNMRNSSYGFDAIANRFGSLEGKPKYLEDQFIYDLSDILEWIYTPDFENHNGRYKGRLLNLADRNKIPVRDAISDEEEARAFTNGDFIRLHMSSTSKVEIIDQILHLEERKKLKVAPSKFTYWGVSIPGLIEIVKNHWLLLLLWSLLVGTFLMAIEPVIQRIFGTN